MPPTYASAVASLPRAAKPAKSAAAPESAAAPAPKPAAPAPAPEESEPTQPAAKPAAAEQPAPQSAAPEAVPAAAPAAQETAPAAPATAAAPVPTAPAAPAPAAAKPGFFGRLLGRKPANAAPQPSSPNVSSSAPAASAAAAPKPALSATIGPRAAPPAPGTPEWHAQDYATNGVKAQAFKSWFGDWEAAPHAASKVVNPETGEPQPTYEIPPEATTAEAQSGQPGASKVTDKIGAPARVYHGTPRGPFHVFDKGQIANAEQQLFGPGFYFTEDPHAAEVFAKGGHSGSAQGTNPTVMSYYLKAHRPFDVDSHLIDPSKLPPLERAGVRASYVQKALAEDGRSAALEAGREFDAGKIGLRYRELTSDNGVGGYGASKQAVQEMLQKQGYDAMTVQADDVGEPGANRYWIVFDNRQMKSAHNRGTFDPNEPHVLKALDALPAPQAIALAARLSGVAGLRTRAQARAAYLKAFDSDAHPRESSAHDSKKPGEFAPKSRASAKRLTVPPNAPIDARRFHAPAGGEPFDLKVWDNSDAFAIFGLRPQWHGGRWVWGVHDKEEMPDATREEIATKIGAPMDSEDEATRNKAWNQTYLHDFRGRPLDPHELWMANLPGGEAPQAGEQDWRPDETIPEDYYAKMLAEVAFTKARGHKPGPQQRGLWDEEEHPRETEAHDEKRPGEFAPKSSNTGNATAYNEVEGAKSAPEPPKPAEGAKVEAEVKTPGPAKTEEPKPTEHPMAALAAKHGRTIRGDGKTLHYRTFVGHGKRAEIERGGVGREVGEVFVSRQTGGPMLITSVDKPWFVSDDHIEDMDAWSEYKDGAGWYANYTAVPVNETDDEKTVRAAKENAAKEKADAESKVKAASDDKWSEVSGLATHHELPAGAPKDLKWEVVADGTKGSKFGYGTTRYMAALPDGTKIGREVSTGYDDHRETYYLPKNLIESPESKSAARLNRLEVMHRLPSMRFDADAGRSTEDVAAEWDRLAADHYAKYRTTPGGLSPAMKAREAEAEKHVAHYPAAVRTLIERHPETEATLAHYAASGEEAALAAYKDKATEVGDEAHADRKAKYHDAHAEWHPKIAAEFGAEAADKVAADVKSDHDEYAHIEDVADRFAGGYDDLVKEKKEAEAKAAKKTARAADPMVTVVGNTYPHKDALGRIPGSKLSKLKGGWTWKVPKSQVGKLPRGLRTE